jgi:hypothetical protein
MDRVTKRKRPELKVPGREVRDLPRKQVWVGNDGAAAARAVDDGEIACPTSASHLQNRRFSSGFVFLAPSCLYYAVCLWAKVGLCELGP